jgi:hypothetical protein
MKDFKFCFVLFLVLAFHSLIAQTDYNKVDEKEKKWGLERVLSRVQRLRYEGTLNMERNWSFSFMMIRKQNNSYERI